MVSKLNSKKLKLSYSWPRQWPVISTKIKKSGSSLQRVGLLGIIPDITLGNPVLEIYQCPAKFRETRLRFINNFELREYLRNADGGRTLSWLQILASLPIVTFEYTI